MSWGAERGEVRGTDALPVRMPVDRASADPLSYSLTTDPSSCRRITRAHDQEIPRVLAFLSTPVGRFRAVAIAEAISWAGLLIGMFFKYVVVETGVIVSIFGPIHGAMFLLYVVVALVTWPIMRWSTGVGVVALAAAVPPFGTWVFERWALRTGRLVDPPAVEAEPGRA